MNKCLVCEIEIESSKAKTCSARCRKLLSRASVTQNVSVTSKKQTSVTFSFTVARKKNDDRPNPVRTARYWYDVPISAVPKLKEGWPKMPDYMDGRQYFLWWKNDFQTKEDGRPIIHNPFPVHDRVEYVKAGEGSRYWGTV